MRNLFKKKQSFPELSYSEVTAALIIVANRYTKKWNYVRETIKLGDSSGRLARSFISRSKEGDSRIEVRDRFGSPRLDIHSPNKTYFISLEYREGVYSESQVWKDEGTIMYPKIKEEVRKELNKIYKAKEREVKRWMTKFLRS